MEKKVIWNGSTTCDICNRQISETLYDAKTWQGCWGTLCESCFRKYGISTGVGFGQKYRKNQETGNFEKIEG